MVSRIRRQVDLPVKSGRDRGERPKSLSVRHFASLEGGRRGPRHLMNAAVVVICTVLSRVAHALKEEPIPGPKNSCVPVILWYI